MAGREEGEEGEKGKVVVQEKGEEGGKDQHSTKGA